MVLQDLDGEIEKAGSMLDGVCQSNWKTISDEEPYNKFLDDSVSGLMSLAGQKNYFPLELLVVTAELSKKFKSAGGVDRTPKGDLEVYDPDNSKYRVGISMKKGAGAQLASALAAKEYVKRWR